MLSSIIICTRNRKKELFRLCRSIATQDRNDFEVIIVDSSDKAEVKLPDIMNILNNKVEIRIIYSEPGLTKQRNIGIKHAKGDLYFFFDDDLILEPNFLSEMIKTFKRDQRYYGGMGAFSSMSEFTFKLKIRKMIRRFFLLQQDYGNGKCQKSGFPMHANGCTRFTEAEVIAGGITAYKSDIFKEFSFDEHFEAYSYMEDVDFSRRVSRKYRLFYNPNARAEHRHGGGGRGNYYENRRMYIYNHRYLFRKNFPQNYSSKIAHAWSIFGLYMFALITLNNPVIAFKGYTKGLVDFHKFLKTSIK